MTDARAFWIVEPGRGAVLPAHAPCPAPGEVRVRALVGGISRGTESLVFLGRVPPGLADIMRCPFQDGQFPAPVKYGYATVGLVEDGEPDLRGRRVFCLHPHQDVFTVPAASVLPVPDAVPSERAVLAANMETALNILWDARPAIGARIAVVGGGVVGCLVAFLAARMPGTRVRLIDIDPGRRPVAEALGVPFATPERAEGGCDLVVHASGAEAGLVTALGLAGVEATVVEASWYGDRPVSAPLGEAFHPNRLRLMSSQVGMVAPAMRPRWTHRARLGLALDLLADPRPDVLLSGESPFEDLPSAMARLARDPGGALCHLVRYP